MKKIMKKMKGKKVLSFVLAVVMMTTLFSTGILPDFGIKAEAALQYDSEGNIVNNGVTQKRVVSNWETTYEQYATQYLNGASNPTDIVLPGLNITNQDTTDTDPGDYVIQGMSYYPEKDWMLVTAYHNDGGVSSKIFALDAATGNFVAMFDFYNPGTQTLNTDHGGGIAISENNLYYACGDQDRKIAYAPLSEFDVPVGTYKTIQLVDSVELYELGDSYTAYVCFDEGILWTGNFYDLGTVVAGVYPVADEYKNPANAVANSMVFGYELKGTKSTDEWANFKSLVGSPSYSIALSNGIKDVQYAVVDNGKLYLSRSYGSGAGNSVSFGFGNCSWLTVADIDLSVPGTKDITIKTDANGTTKTIKAHSIETFENYPMMPMSEGLCVIDGDIFITFESASNKYKNESDSNIMGIETSISNCEKPVDVVWQLDPYKLMEQEVAEPENSIYYEKVNSLSEIKNGEEYLIFHESNRESPVTQKNVLYALNADGNFKDYKLSKSSVSTIIGYDGMIGQPIIYYSFGKNEVGKDILYLENAEEDDIESLRWTISNIGGLKYSIKTTEPYFANTNCLYFDEDQITMSPDNAAYLSNIEIMQLVDNSGYFYLRNTKDMGEAHPENSGYFLWCNDGLVENYNNKANAYYANNATTTPIFNGITEAAGTFHCDAMNFSGKNVIGSMINIADDDPDIPYEDGAFCIYKRVKDDISSTYESRVFTDFNAELQADGTYTIDLETYAISPNHYRYVGERPTDYIFVVDTSSSMGTNDGAGLISYGGSATGETLAISSLCVQNDIDGDAGKGINGYSFTNPDEDIYYLHSDGNYYQLKLAVNTPKLNGFSVLGNYTVTSITQNYWAYYIADDGLYYVLKCQDSTNGVFDGVSYETFVSNVENNKNYTRTTDKLKAGDRLDLTASTDPHYRFSTNTGEDARLKSIQTIATDLVDDIYAQNSQNRIALVQYGGSNGFYNTNGTLSTNDYANAYWGASSAETLISKINGLTTSAQNDDSGIEMKYANELMSKSGVDYTATGNRNAIIIFMSDGVPGTDSGSNTLAAANNVIGAAKTAKNNGAFIYSVLVGHETVNSFSTKTYMDAVSSKYQGATSMTNLGGQSIDGVVYAHTLASITLKDFTKFGLNTVKQTAVNTAVGLANLDAGSILREKLSDLFIIPTDKEPDVSFIKGEFDAIGRFSFDEDNPQPADVYTDWSAENPDLLTVTGYDYASEYIARGKTGNKLRIRFEGVLADETKTIQNTPISNTATTALYQKPEDMTADGGNAFKKLPTVYFNIPKYTYVLDYGLQMLDTDVNGTLKSVSAHLSAQRNETTNEIEYKDVSENGLVKIQSGNENLLYHNTPTNTTDSGYVLIQRDSGKYDWFEIEVVPASNVYFEEKEFATDAGTGTVAWTTTTGGTTEEYRSLPGENDIYGYDKAYDNENTYSNGTAFSASVDSTNKRSKTATVSFAGDGIDIVSACGPTTGMQIINIKDATGKSVAASIVDTYYADATFSQVPIFSWRGAYGDYIVETTAVYLSTAGALTKSSFKNSIIDTGLVMNSSDSLNTTNVEAMLDAAGVEDIDAENLELVWFDDNSVLNGGTGVAPTKKGARAGETESVTLNNYLDGFRVYNPVGSDSSAYDVGEQNAVYHSVIDSLADGTLSDGSLDFASGTVAFVAGSLADGETLSFANYESVGPKNELYLRGGATTKGLFFKTPVADGGKVMISLRAVNGPTTVSINGSDPINVTSATEMYYDITDLLTVEDGAANVTIINTGNGILAVNNIKLTNTVSASGLMPLGMEDLETVQYYASMEPVQVSVKDGVITPVVIEDEIPDDGTNTGNNDTTTDNEETEESFSIFSLIEALLAFIKEILVNSVGSGNLF